MKTIKIIEIAKLKSHEKTNQHNLKKIIRAIRESGHIENPIIIEKDNYIILDGHHRTRALTMLGYRKVPAYIVDYLDRKIRVLPRRLEIEVSKEKVIRQAMSGKTFPYKTTKHLIPNRPKEVHIPLKILE